MTIQSVRQRTEEEEMITLALAFIDAKFGGNFILLYCGTVCLDLLGLCVIGDTLAAFAKRGKK